VRPFWQRGVLTGHTFVKSVWCNTTDSFIDFTLNDYICPQNVEKQHCKMSSFNQMGQDFFVGTFYRFSWHSTPLKWIRKCYESSMLNLVSLSVPFLYSSVHWTDMIVFFDSNSIRICNLTANSICIFMLIFIWCVLVESDWFWKHIVLKLRCVTYGLCFLLSSGYFT